MLFLECEENSKGELVVKDLKVELLGMLKKKIIICHTDKISLFW